jgi:hypothetical protein
MSELHNVAREGDVAKLVALLANSPDLDARDKLSRTPLILAAWAGHLVGQMHSVCWPGIAG